MESNLLMSGKTQFSPPTPADNDAIPLSMTAGGQVRVATKPDKHTSSSNALSALNSVLTVDVSEASNIIAHVKNTGSVTMAAGTFVFEGSIDSTTGTDGAWFALQAVRTDSNTVESSTGTLGLTAGSAMTYAWELSVNAVKWFRVRCSVATTASSTATWTAIRGSYATEPAPAIQSHAVSVSNTPSVNATIVGTPSVNATPVGTTTVSGSVSITGTPSVNAAVTGTVTDTPTNGSTYNVVTTASTNGANVKSSAGNLYEVTVSNVTGTAMYVKFYNKATAPTVGTDVPVLTIPVAASTVAGLQFGPLGKRFATGISIAVTAAAAASDTGVAAAGAQINATYL